MRRRTVYIASSVSAVEQARETRLAIEKAGHLVTSRWMLGNHEADEAEMGNMITENGMIKFAKFGADDIEDMQDAECGVFLTETPSGRGGMHVGFGYMIALGKRIFIVGPIRNVFQAWAIQCNKADHLRTIEHFLQMLKVDDAETT